MPKIWQFGKNIVTLHSQSGNDDTERKQKPWCGSSAWLEYMPVTHGVAGSSPVRTAEERGRGAE